MQLREESKNATQSREAKLTAIMSFVANQSERKVEEIKGRGRTTGLVKKRVVFAYLALKYCTESFAVVGDFIGGRDRNTMRHYKNNLFQEYYKEVEEVEAEFLRVNGFEIERRNLEKFLSLPKEVQRDRMVNSSSLLPSKVNEILDIFYKLTAIAGSENVNELRKLIGEADLSPF